MDRTGAALGSGRTSAFVLAGNTADCRAEKNGGASPPRPRPAWPSSPSSRAGHNPSRRHSALGYLSPADYERRRFTELPIPSP